jgi:hypothetical protein
MKILYGACMQWMDGTAYYARGVSYARKIFMKSVVDLIKLFTAVSYDFS